MKLTERTIAKKRLTNNLEELSKVLEEMYQEEVQKGRNEQELE